jgi:hypothetical protein
MSRAALFAILILAACTSDGEPAATTAPPEILTTIGAAPAPPASTATTTIAPATTTTTTTTTTTQQPPNAAPEFGLTQVVFGESSFVIITNWGNATGNLEGYWLAQGTLYKSLPDIELAPGEQALLGLARTPPPELAGIADNRFLGPTIGELNPESGEVALFSSSSFDDPDSIVSYVEWGDAGHTAATVAVAAGIWLDSAVDVFDEAPSISTGVFPATSSDSWFADVGG